MQPVTCSLQSVVCSLQSAVCSLQSANVRHRELDGYCKQLKLAFEYDGIQHHVYPNPFHKSKEG